MSIKRILTSVTGSCAIATSAVLAAPAMSQVDLHPYVGGNYGLYKSDDGDYDEDKSLWELYGGLSFNQYIGIEAGYTQLGEFNSDLADAEVDGVTGAIVGTLPLTDRFDIYGKIGRLWWDADVDTFTDSESIDGDEFFYTLGAGMAITDPLWVTVEYSRYDIDLEGPDFLGDADEAKMDTIKAGVKFMF